VKSEQTSDNRRTPTPGADASASPHEQEDASGSPHQEGGAGRSPRRRCNNLDGKRWLQNSISVWSDIRKTAEESRLKHPAMFPQMLVDRLLETFLPPGGTTVLDPFAGTGSTLVAAARQGLRGVGLEISPDYVQLAQQRLQHVQNPAKPDSAAESGAQSRRAASRRMPPAEVICDSALNLRTHVPDESVDLCITSPPYWNILTRRRTADYKAVRHYGDNDGDFGTIEDYEDFLASLTAVFEQVFAVLRPGAFCCVVVMDLRKKKHFFPLHSHLAERLTECGFVYDDLLIWNRQSEYNNLRPLGYPSVFRVNRVHEFILLMQKPKPA